MGQEQEARSAGLVALGVDDMKQGRWRCSLFPHHHYILSTVPGIF